MITKFKIKREDEIIELEVEFDGYLESDEYDENDKFFQINEIYSVIDEDGNDWLEDLEEDELEKLEEKCEREGYRKLIKEE